MSTGDQETRLTTASEIKQRSNASDSEKKGGGLAGLSAQLGNDGLMERLTAGNGNRDDLLDFILQRLGSMRDIQLAELDLCKDTSNSMTTTLAESGMQHDKPDPTRWIQAANLYQDAARALCSGQLHRGNELLDQAVAEERRQKENLTSLVDVVEERLQGPDVSLSSNVACTDCPEPEGLKVADEIQSVTTDGHISIKGQRRELDPWWTDLEEEEEEEEANG